MLRAPMAGLALQLLAALLVVVTSSSSARPARAATTAATAPAAAGPAANATLLWCSDPVRPNETLMVQYASAAALVDPIVNLRPVSSSGPPLSLAPSQVTRQTISFVLPADLAIDAFEISISHGSAGGSNTIVANQPVVWWVQGDGGSFATTGGWVRAFGHGLALPAASTTDASHSASAGERRLQLELRELARQLVSAAQRGDWVRSEDITRQVANLTAQQQRATDAALVTTLTLSTHQPAADDAAPIIIRATNTTEYASFFQLPQGVTPGKYSVAVGNGVADGALDSYYNHGQPRVTTIEIKPATATAWGTMVVHVTDYGCQASLSNYSDPRDCTSAILSAIEAVNGTGGTVQFGLGRFYVRAPLLLPNGVRLAGAGMGKTGLYFASINNSTDNPRSFITNSEPGRFGLQDLDIYVLAFYVNIIHISSDTDGVQIKRVRLRANAFHCQNGGNRQPAWHLAASTNCNWNGDCPNPWPYHVQPAIMLLGRNYEISGCDLWATWNVFYSGLTQPPAPPGPPPADKYATRGPWINSEFGLITGNTLWNGGNCHWFDSIHQLIYEGNTCTGNSPMAGGNNIATYSGDATHHLYLAGNVYRQAYGNDRETMTFDDFGSAYYGSYTNITLESDGTAILKTPGGNRSTVGGAKKNDVVNYDKAIVIVNGSGAGQYRRVTEWKWENNPDGESTWHMHRPFDVDPEPTALVTIMTFRGENIFFQNTHEDSGAFQFYGAGISNYVVGLTGTRMGGFITAGMGSGDQGLNPNLYNQFIDVTVTEGLRADHREESLLSGNFIGPTPSQQRCLVSTQNDTLQCGSGFEFGDRLSSLAEVNSFSIMTGSCSVAWRDGEIDEHRYIVLRGNHVQSNGGFFIDGGSDIIMEHNSVANFAPGFSAAPRTRGGRYMEQPLTAPLPFAITNFTGGEGCPRWGCNQLCRGPHGVISRGNVQK